jgi:CheY-like chemotaxis protein
LTQQLLTFSRRHLAELEVLDPSQVASALEPMLRRLIGEHIVLRTNLVHDLGRVRANRSQLEQIVMNLAVNARDAMPNGGTLTIETQSVETTGAFAQEQLRLEPGPYVVLSVSDTGEGMDAITQASIFEPFFSTKGPEGTGLGLATVYGIVQQAGGAIYVYSEPGQGSVFKVYLPQLGAVPSAPLPAAPAAPPTQPDAVRATILLVEDEPGVRAFVAQVLQNAGYGVLTAENGLDALALAEGYDGRIDLLFTDVVMPGLNGRALAERLRASRPEMPVLYTSGYTDDVVIRTGVVTAGAAFLEKPFTPQSLLERVRMALPARTGAP